MAYDLFFSGQWSVVLRSDMCEFLLSCPFKGEVVHRCDVSIDSVHDARNVSQISLHDVKGHALNRTLLLGILYGV